MKSERANRILKLSASCLIVLSVSFSAANGQTARRKTRRTVKPTRAVITLPPPTSGEAEIIARAGDETVAGNQVLIAPENQPTAPAETLESKIDKVGSNVRDLKTRVKSLEGNKQNEYDEKQRRLALNLDILTKAESRAESLRKQMFDLAEKEDTIKTRLEQLENDSRPEMIDRQVAFAGSLRPEELRELRRKNMESEKTNLESLLAQVQSSRQNLDLNVQKADALVEKLRFKLEKDIDDALAPEEEPKQ